MEKRDAQIQKYRADIPKTEVEGDRDLNGQIA
jgi:hypothetical protein